MLLDKLPSELEDVDALLRREDRAYKRKDQWRSVYTECYRYAMPSRETFNEYSPGQEKASRLFDSTLQENTYEAANTLCAILFPPWTRWAELAPGGAMPKDSIPQEILSGLQKATQVFFDFLNHSNFSSVMHECALDLLVGTCALDFDEGDNTKPFMFQSTPLALLELEEGPFGTVETTWTRRKPQAGHLLRLYKGMQLSDLPETLASVIREKPETEVEVVQGEIYHPESGKYFGVAIDRQSKSLIWRYAYGDSCPKIVARATKISGEVYGRGRVMLALPDARTLDKMMDFVLRQAAIQIAPPLTGVSDGVLNPYTATVQPNTIIPVASNDRGNPSIQVLDVGGNFNITNEMLLHLRERIRRVMLGPEMSAGPIKTATEITISDRNRLWAMNGEFSRIQAELLAKIIARGVWILQRKGLIPKFKVDGREVSINYTSPFAKSQASEDLMSLQTTIELSNMAAGPQGMNLGLKTEEMPKWIAGKTGLDQALVRDDAERLQLTQQMAQAAAAAMEAGADVKQMGRAASGG